MGGVLEKGTRRRVGYTTGTEKNQTEGNYGRKEVRDQEKHRTIAVRRLEVPGARGVGAEYQNLPRDKELCDPPKIKNKTKQVLVPEVVSINNRRLGAGGCQVN